MADFHDNPGLICSLFARALYADLVKILYSLNEGQEFFVFQEKPENEILHLILDLKNYNVFSVYIVTCKVTFHQGAEKIILDLLSKNGIGYSAPVSNRFVYEFHKDLLPYQK